MSVSYEEKISFYPFTHSRDPLLSPNPLDTNINYILSYFVLYLKKKRTKKLLFDTVKNRQSLMN